MRKKLSKTVLSTAFAAARKASSSRSRAGRPPPSVAAAVAEATGLATEKKLVQAPCFVASASFSSGLLTKDSAKKKKKPGPGASTQLLQQLKKSAAKRRDCRDPAPAEASKAEDTNAVIGAITDILQGSSNMVPSPSPKSILDSPWFADSSEDLQAQERKEILQNRKQKWKFKGTESYWLNKLIKNCAMKYGPESILEVFGRIGRDTSIKDYNALIKLCIKKARESSEDVSVHVHKVYQLFVSMREKGFQIEEDSFGPFLQYMIDVSMVEEFQVFTELIKDVNPDSYYRLGYYEMLLWIRVGDEGKIRELCSLSGVSNDNDCYNLAVSYLLAFCKSDRQEELQQLLEVIDITGISSTKYLSIIFESLGRLQLENFMGKFISALNSLGDGENNVSSFIYDYATNVPNLTVEEIISKFINLHEQYGVLPSVVSCDSLIKLCRNSSEVRAAMNVLDLICQSGVEIPDDFFDPLLHACERCCEFDMVHGIYSLMRCQNLKPKGTTFKSMISLCVRMKDFEGAYKMLSDAREMKTIPTASMYNAIMAGYFREKNNTGALMVLKQMEAADVQPDSETYCHLIANSECEEDLSKYRDEMCAAGVEKTKHFYMALINAFTKFGRFELAKQVIQDHDIQSKYLSEVKSVLVSALSSNGQIADALHVYDELKQAGCCVEPRAVISLIEHIQSEDAFDRLFQLLEELNGSSFWFDGCSRAVLYCVQHNLATPAIELLKKFREKDKTSICVVLDQIFGKIWEAGPPSLKTGMELVHAIKEELHLQVSRTSLDFLLSSCVKANDLHRAQLVWSEYENAGLSYNVLTYLRMYQVLLASGEEKKASKLLRKIRKDDPHVKYIIGSCRAAFKMPPHT